MAKGSVRKKGKKWYYRFYVEDASGQLVQKECVGTESKSETEKLLRQAMNDYESNRYIAKPDNITLGQLLSIWVEEDLKTGTMSNGTVELYQNIVKFIKKHPIRDKKLSSLTSEHLQKFMDQLAFGNTEGDDVQRKGNAKSYAPKVFTVLNHAFRFAVFPKRYIALNPMQYVVLHRSKNDADIFGYEEDEGKSISPLTDTQYRTLIKYLKAHHPYAVLPVTISYYTGLRVGEVCGLTWKDINLDEQYLTVRRSVRYDTLRHKVQIGTTKCAKIRTVDFGNTLTKILKKAKRSQESDKKAYGPLYHECYFKEVGEKNRIYYEYYALDKTEVVPEDYHEIDFVCRKEDGALVLPATLETMCTYLRKGLPELGGFHFHVLRHTFTTNLLAKGAKPKDVQELLGHSTVSTTMDIYAHATRESKKASARLLD